MSKGKATRRNKILTGIAGEYFVAAELSIDRQLTRVLILASGVAL